MPIYDYHCDHCGHSFSAVQSFKDEALAKCPSCGQHPRRLISQPSIVFKGSGWYKTDSRSARTSKDGQAEKDTSAPSSEKAEKTEKGSDKQSDKASDKPSEKRSEKGSATPS